MDGVLLGIEQLSEPEALGECRAAAPSAAGGGNSEVFRGRTEFRPEIILSLLRLRARTLRGLYVLCLQSEAQALKDLGVCCSCRHGNLCGWFIFCNRKNRYRC